MKTARLRSKSWRGDDAGAVQTFEAVLAAIIILTALVFFALVQRPAVAEEKTGWELEQIASDTLAILQTATDAPNDLESEVREIMSGAAGAATSLETTLTALLPQGFRWLLSIDNGFGTLQLASSETGSFSQPRGALGATAFVTLGDDWTATGGSATDVQPGGTVSVPGTCTGLDAPDAGTEMGPQEVSWFSRLTVVGGQATVPAGFPFGAWAFTGTGCVSSFDLVAGSIPTAATPVYAVHLVVWANV